MKTLLTSQVCHGRRRCHGTILPENVFERLCGRMNLRPQTTDNSLVLAQSGLYFFHKAERHRFPHSFHLNHCAGERDGFSCRQTATHGMLFFALESCLPYLGWSFSRAHCGSFIHFPRRNLLITLYIQSLFALLPGKLTLILWRRIVTKLFKVPLLEI